MKNYNISIDNEWDRTKFSVLTTVNRDEFHTKSHDVNNCKHEDYFNGFFKNTPYNISKQNFMPFCKLFEKLNEIFSGSNLNININNKKQMVNIQYEFENNISPKTARVVYYRIFNQDADVEYYNKKCKIKQTTKFIDNNVNKTIEKCFNELCPKIITRLKEIINTEKERVKQEAKNIEQAEADLML